MKILLIGDSIRMSYQARVKEKLLGAADVVAPEENCRFAKYSLWNFCTWVAELGQPDIIHWNNGIWDAYHLNADIGVFTPLDEYKTYLKRLLKEMRKTGAKIIWATTTAVNDQCGVCNNAEIDLYNAEAVKLMQAEGLEINDLNRLIKANIAGYIAEDGVHLTPDGIEVCAAACATVLARQLHPGY
jgi:hypothetical protein